MKREKIELNKYAERFLVPEINFEGAVNMAYGDMARHTLRIDADDKRKQQLKEALADYLKEQFEVLCKIENEENYNKWHETTCDGIIDKYNGQLSYGQAQKWVNMLVKYCYVYNIEILHQLFENDDCVNWLHVALDRKMLEKAHRLGCSCKTAWSKMGKDEYLNFQRMLKATIKAKCADGLSQGIPFYWELIEWNQ